MYVMGRIWRKRCIRGLGKEKGSKDVLESFILGNVLETEQVLSMYVCKLLNYRQFYS